MRTALALTALAAAGLAVGGVAVANAASPAPAATAAPATPVKARHKARPALHSDAVRRGPHGSFVTVGTQRGTVTAVSPTSLTARSADGFERTYVLGPDSKVRLDKKDATVTDLKVGEKVGVTALQTGSTWTARRAVARS